MRYLFKYQKQPDEIRSMGIDFADDLVSGEIISSAAVTYTDMSNGSDAESIIKDAVPQIVNGDATNSVVSVRIKAGSDGDMFNIKIVATTSGSEKIEGDIILTIRKLGYD